MSKRNLFVVGIIGSGIFFSMFFLALKFGCDEGRLFFCRDSFIWIVDVCRLFLPLFLLSLITYKMRDEMYQAWYRFVRWSIPLSILLILITPEYGGGILPLDKGRVSFILSLLFLVISLAIILVKYVQTRPKSI